MPPVISTTKEVIRNSKSRSFQAENQLVGDMECELERVRKKPQCSTQNKKVILRSGHNILQIRLQG